VSGSTPLSASAAELLRHFRQTLPTLAVECRDYVFLQEGGRDYSTDTAPGHDTGCDVSGCRGEILKIASGEAATRNGGHGLAFSLHPVVTRRMFPS